MIFTRRKCPNCNSKNVVNIVYGLIEPRFDEESAIYRLFSFFQRDDWVSGGCVIEEDSPERLCTNCGHEWK